MTIGSARGLATGTRVTVEGVVTSESGAILDLRTVAVQDATGGLLAVLPSRNAPALARGDLVAITGRLASRSGTLQLNVSAPSDVRLIGADAVPAPRPVTAASLGEGVEGLLVRAGGTVTRVTRATSGSATLLLSDATGALTVSCSHSCASGLKKGARLQVTGIAGQRALRSGALDGYRIWPRDDGDLVSLAAESGAGAGDAREAGAEAAPSPPAASITAIARARTRSGSVTIEAVVTTQPGFIDPDPRRVVVQDDSGGILVRLPADAPSMSVGDRIRATGRAGTYSGAAQLTASHVAVIVHHVALSPRALATVPAPADEWRLVRADGRVQAVHRYGVTWRAEIRLPGGSVVPVQGTSRSGVPSTALIEGRDASVSGIVRRPSAAAADQRLAVLPRAASDVALGPGDAGAGGAAAGHAASSLGGRSGSGLASGGSADRTASGSGTGATALDIDLADLGSHPGALVRVGGIVSALRTDGVTLDDGTGTGDVRLADGASALLRLIERGAAVNVTGLVQQATGGIPVVVVSDAAAVALVGDLGEAVPLAGVGNGTATGSGSDESEVRAVTELRVGPVAVAVPEGSPSAALGVVALLVVLGAAVALPVWRRLRADRRERTGRAVAARLATLLTSPQASAGSRSGTDPR
jgi:DNA/RNA endonuclease YhcR with UshA esterase domain